MPQNNIWKNQQLKRLILAGIPADFADWLDYVAIAALLAFTWESGPWSLAWLAIAMGAPYLVVGPFAGALIDKSNLRTVLIFANLGRAITTASLIFAPNVAILLALVFARGAIDSAFTPARQATIQVLANKNQRDGVNSIVHGINQASKIAGPALGGALLVWFSPQWIFGINAVISLIATLIIWGIVIPVAKASEQLDEGGALFQVIAGFVEVKNNSKLMAGISFVAVSMFAVFLYDTFLVLLALDFGFEVSIYGLSIAAVGAGGVLGAFLVSKVTFGNNHLQIMGSASFVSGVIVAGGAACSILDVPIDPIAFLLGFFLIGICVAFVQIPYRSLLQLETAPEKMARVVAIGEAIIAIAMLSAPLLGGFLVTQFEIGIPFAVGGALMIFIGIIGAMISSK